MNEYIKYINEGINDYLNNANLSKYPWHMPGHKRKNRLETLTWIAKYDFTEVPGLDDYHHPTGMIKKSISQLKEIYKTDYSNYIVNGTTAGNLSAIFATCNRNDKVLVARNCHKSIYNAINLLELEAVYITPNVITPNGTADQISDGITITDIKDIFENNGCESSKIKACIITSPTFEGIVSDVLEISEFLHSKGVYLIVDEAHGAHFPFASWLFESASRQGADIVIQSLHKTMPCINQCSVIHVSNKLDEKLSQRVNKYLGVFQTSSPSYIMLANMEDIICWAVSREGQQEFNRFNKELLEFREKVGKLINIKLLSSVRGDITRLVFFINKNNKEYNFSGDELAKVLEEKYGIVLEMAGLDYVVAISTVFDEKENFDLLYEGLKYCDGIMKHKLDQEEYRLKDLILEVSIKLSKKTVSVEELNKLVDKGESVKATTKHFIYPPGIPVINEGEEFTKEITNTITKWLRGGKSVRGINHSV